MTGLYCRVRGSTGAGAGAGAGGSLGTPEVRHWHCASFPERQILEIIIVLVLYSYLWHISVE